MSTAGTTLPYCGTPPDPSGIWSRWRLDPVVLAVLAAVWVCFLVAYLRARRRHPHAAPARAQFACFNTGWAIALLALVSPLCALSVSLFAARAAQHVLLTLIAAPLIVAGAPLRAFTLGWTAQRTPARLRSLGRRWFHAPVTASAAFAVVVWVWHMPAPYAATFASAAVYWAMHASMFGAALWLWTTLLGEARRAVVGGLFASIGSAIQMGLLGALITLSPQPFYAPHLLTTGAWGLSPLQDQQLGGVIMWVVGCTAFFAVAMVGIAHALSGRELAPLPLRATMPARRISPRAATR